MALVMMISVSGCGKKLEQAQQEETKKQEETQMQDKEPTAPTEYQFDAIVSEISEDFLMVEVLEGQNVAGEVKIWIGALETSVLEDLEVGNTVRITHDGKMTMSIPPQMSAVKLTVLSGTEGL